MDQYLDFSAFQDQAEDSGEGSIHQPQHFAHAVNAPLQDQSRTSLYHPVQPPMSCEVKPRLTKEQHDILEAHFQGQHKPSTSTKKNFAETLNVSLDKVNNWFQNRRAKSKQDAKKAAGQVTLYQNHSQHFSSDSEPSPFQPSQQYTTMMQHMSSEEHLPNALGISQVPQQQPQPQPQGHGLPFDNDMTTADQLQNFNWSQGMSQDMYDSQLELNRRTITQEQFNLMHQNGGAMNGAGEFESIDVGFSGDQDALNQVFPEFDNKQGFVAFPYPIVAPPLSSNDSTVPSIASEAFPSSHLMQTHPSISGASSDWADSRSSSLASAGQGHMAAPMMPGQQQSHAATSHWEPGKSVPVDVNAMKGEFEQAAAQANQVRASMEQNPAFEQPLAWPEDGAYGRRDSTASMLAQSMGNVGLHTPQTNQSNGVFKSPAPPSNIAARRQRNKPANLGIASLRSQSHGSAGQPGSPGHQHNIPQGQSIRRVMSSNVLSGGVAQGRVMKSVPGSAQRSPLNWNFDDALNSPLVRAVSQGNLAPPTPMSPSYPNQMQQVNNWHNGSNQVSRHPSINENDEQHGFVGLPYQPSGSVPPHVSPPHTPHWWQQQFIPHRIGSNVITENTPPQSAPASQSCFPSNIFAPPQPHIHAPQPQMPMQQQMAAMAQQHYANPPVPEQQYMPNITFASNQHANVVTSGPPPGMPLTFATGVPVVNADGNIQMSFPAQMQMMQPHSDSSPPQMPYAFVNSNGNSPGMAPMQPPKLATQPANDFVVHEYSPPDAMKRSVTTRRPVDSGPKNYTFANAGPVDYEDKKMKKEMTGSPASSSSTASTS